MRGSRNVRAVALGVVAIPLASLLAPAPADARSVRYSRERPETTETKPARMPDGPINIVISIGSQRLWVYDKRGLLETSIVSTGTSRLPDADRRVRHPRQGGDALLQHLRRRLDALHAAPDHVGRRPALRRDHRPARLARLHPPAACLCQALFGLTEPGRARDHRPQRAGAAAIAHAGLFVRRPAHARWSRRHRHALPRRRRQGRRVRSAEGDGRCPRRQDHGLAGGRAAGHADLGVRQQGRGQGVSCATASGRCSRPHRRSPIPSSRSARTCSPRSEFKDDGTACAGSVSVPASSEQAAQPRKVSRASRNESEPMLPRSERPAVDGRRGARPHRVAQGGARAHLAAHFAGLGADRLRPWPQPRDARERHHRFHRADALTPADMLRRGALRPLPGRCRWRRLTFTAQR